MNIILIGYRGAGKSAVGKRLAGRLRMRFVDIDDLVEESHGASIREIVESAGWEHFRAMEKATIQEIAQQSGFIIAPGGGAVLDPENVKSLKNRGLIVWLKAEPEVLAERMSSDPQTIGSRPTLTGKGALAEIREVMSSRESIYKKAATIELDTSTLDIEAVVEKVLSILQKRLDPAEGHCDPAKAGREARGDVALPVKGEIASLRPEDHALPGFPRNDCDLGEERG